MKEGLESKVSFSSFDNICKVCPLDYADDLKFWGINESFMEFCCQVPNQTVEVNDIKICDIGRIENAVPVREKGKTKNFCLQDKFLSRREAIMGEVAKNNEVAEEEEVSHSVT